MASEDPDERLLEQIRERANALLEGLARDGESLRASSDPSHAEGAALWEQAAAEARRLIAELDSKTNDNERPQP